MSSSISPLSSSDSLLSSLAASGSSGSSTTSLLNSGSATSSSSNASDAVTVDLSDFAKAAASGDSSGKSAALMQLKTDLNSEETALLGSVSNYDSSTSDIGDEVLSAVYGTMGSTSTSSALSDVQTLAAKSTGTLVDTTA